MTDKGKTKEQLLDELNKLRSEIEKLKESERIVKESEQRYREFADNINDGFFEYDLQGKIIFCNETLPRIFGYTHDEFMKLDRYERHESREYAKYVFRQYVEMYKKNTSTKLMEYRARCKDGRTIEFESSVSLIRDSKGNVVGYRGIGRDITERKKIQHDLERYRDFFENVEDLCAEYDLQGNIIFCNESVPRSFGYTREEMLKLDRYERHESREYAKYVFGLYADMKERNIPSTTMEYRIKCKDGSLRELGSRISLVRDAKGEIVGFRGIGHDITEQKEMLVHMERYRDFFENVGDICAEYDLSGRCLFINEAATRVLGFSREELMSLHHHERYPNREEADRIFRIVREAFIQQLPVIVYVSDLVCKDGTVRALENSVSLIKNSEGIPVGFRSISRDITERKNLEQEQERLHEQLVQARKMEAIGTLAGGIAHDFNNLLMGIQGHASLMLLDMDQKDQHFQNVKAIESHVASGSELTRQLLGYARGGRYEVKPVNLNDIIKKSSEMFGRTKKEIIIDLFLADDLWIVEADYSQMEQVLLNLFVNAWQAMPEGGEIRITTENMKVEQSQAKSLEISTGNYIRATVSDTGVGMDETTRERLFEPFFTTKEMGAARGTGLGLASVYGIIKGHKGAINVQSEKGEGSTFNIYLPASIKDIVHEKVSEKMMVHGHETILIVDDEKAVREVVAGMIQGLGYQVITAGSGEEALTIYRKDPSAFDLVIMDMIMPGLSGGVAIDAIRTLNPDARIILSSGYSLNGEAQEILNRGGIISFMQKPFMLAELSQKIRSILDK